MKFNKIIALSAALAFAALLVFVFMICLFLDGKTLAGTISALVFLGCVYATAGIIGGNDI
jgi:hypothetical protein